MLLTVQVSDELAVALRQGTQAATEASELRQIADELGISLHPLHPGSDDPSLRSYFTVEVPDAAAAQRVIARLRQSPGITAAYVKPPDAMA